MLACVETELRAALADAPADVRMLGEAAVAGPAKRLRPILVFLSANFGNEGPPSLVQAAVALELVHAASLIHDDIIDKADLRRGLPALHVTAGPKAATLIGSHLLYVASRLVQTLSAPSKEVQGVIRAVFGHAAMHACAGQMRELAHIGDTGIAEDVYRAIVEGKTARLFEVACEVGALLSGAPVTILASYGRAFGVLYQLVDDTRDLFETAEVLQRPPGADVAAGVLTMPLILALQSNDGEAAAVRDILRNRVGALSAADLSRIRRAVVNCKAPKQVLSRARALGQQATKAASELPATTTSQAMRRVIDDVLEYLEALLQAAHRSALVNAN
jgi:geranylgeranyl pyrophosphate synthase